MRERSKFILSLAVLAVLIIGCSKLKNLSSSGNSHKLYFCESYDPSTDKCEGKSMKYTEGYLTVMVDLRDADEIIGVSKVNINITNLKTKEVVDTYPYDTSPDMEYVYFDKVDFKSPGKYKVSALKPDGTVIASNEIEIIE
ncbi:MAG: hypothetical protein KDD00_01820 [Ignavibacteriae bacterium]|nr:hypothetical protein [Ignavibacteriota bacterium]